MLNLMLTDDEKSAMTFEDLVFSWDEDGDLCWMFPDGTRPDDDQWDALEGGGTSGK